MRLYVVWADELCDECVLLFRRHRIDLGGRCDCVAWRRRTGGVARLDQADDGATT